MEIIVKTFDELSTSELYDLMQLRSEVFVVEQECAYQDIDGKDQQALHVIGVKENKIVAYARCFKPGYYFKEAAIGRVVVEGPQRKYGLGHEILDASIRAVKIHYKTDNIKLSAQTYLTGFYETHGFKPTGDEYLEDGIPHIAMIRA